MDNNLLKQIQEFKEKFSAGEDQVTIGMWEDTVRKNLRLLSLKDNKGIQVIYDTFDIEVKEMDRIILTATSKELPDYERDLLIMRRDMYKKFLSLFSGAEKALESVQKQLDENAE